jgi:vitamin B12 transporter
VPFSLFRDAFWLALAIVATSLVQPSLASDESSEGMESVVVTGSRVASETDSVTGSVTVIDRDLIERRMDENVLDLLRSVAGVHIAQAGGRSGFASIHMRGGEANFTLVLLDGVKINDPTNERGGAFDASLIPLSQIESIEVMRGVQSSVYGSDGLGGVLHIRTRSSDSDGGSLNVSAGQHGFSQYSLALSQSLGESNRLRLSLSDEDEGDGLRGNFFETQAASISLESRLTDATNLTIRGFSSQTDSRGFPDDSGGPLFAENPSLNRKDREQSGVSAVMSSAAGNNLQINLVVGANQYDEANESPAIAPGARDGVPASNFDSSFRRNTLTLNAVFDASEALRGTIGVDLLDEDGALVGDIELFPGFSLPQDFELQRETMGLFTEVAYEPSETTRLNLSLRTDDADGYSGETTGKLTAQYSLGSSRVYASWGNGFKLPSFYALGHALVGNSALLPETSRTLEVGISSKTTHSQVDASVFRSRYRNLINFDPLAFRLVNEDSVAMTGAELSLRHQLSSNFAIAGSATYVDTDVTGAGRLLQRPDWNFSVSAFWQVAEDLSVAFDCGTIGKVVDSSVPTGLMEIDGYSRMDMNVQWQATPATSFFVALDNAADTAFQTAIGFPGMGLRGRLGVQHRFGFGR